MSESKNYHEIRFGTLKTPAFHLEAKLNAV